MQISTRTSMIGRTDREALSAQLCAEAPKSLAVLLLIGTLLMLSACGGSSSQQKTAGAASGNWQFTAFANTPDLTSTSGLQSGFLLQSNNSITGSLVYSNTLQNAAAPCNSGAASVTGTISGQSVTLTAIAGAQTYTLTGTLNSDGSLTGTYSATPGPTVSVNGTPTLCGIGTSGSSLTFSALSVPPLTGSITGSFHSATSGALLNQNFQVTGTLTQGENVGASNATVTGTLSFVDPITLISDYPCIAMASVNGQISGENVTLQIIGTDGTNIGQIGGPTGSTVNPVTFRSVAPSGYILQSAVTPAYFVNSPSCSGGNSDAGNICLALNGSTPCQQPLSLSPAFLTFAPQLLGSSPTTQTVALSNTDPSGATLDGLFVEFQLPGSVNFSGFSDFNALPNYTATDNCVSGGEILSPNVKGSTFSLAAGQSCTVTVSFVPHESCGWLPFAPSAPSSCPTPMTAEIIVNSPASADGDDRFAVPITGIGLSFIQTATPEIDFGAEAVGEASQPQLLNFTNNGPNPVQILGSGPCTNPPGTIPLTLPYDPLTFGSGVPGLQVAVSGSGFPNSITPNIPSFTTVTYNCDLDPSSNQPNFQISSDSCTGALVPSQGSCSVQITYVPQPATSLDNGLDFFLELNTVQCWPPDSPPADCEVDAGRFPVELKTNPPSPLRMLPSARLNFGNVPVGKSGIAQSITLLNDPVANAPTVNFVGKVLTSGNYSETDDCPFSLAPGSSCTLTVTFKPKSAGYNAGTLTINYTPAPGNVPQTVFLHGTGQ